MRGRRRERRILVFADARQRFSTTALVELIANFADPLVGGVTGELILDCEARSPADSSVGDGVGLYWKYEKWLRRQRVRGVVDPWRDGGNLRARRRLWRPLPAETLLDDVLAP